MPKQLTLAIKKESKPKTLRANPWFKKLTEAKRENQPVTGQWEYLVNRDIYDRMYQRREHIPPHVYAALMDGKRLRATLLKPKRAAVTGDSPSEAFGTEEILKALSSD